MKASFRLTSPEDFDNLENIVLKHDCIIVFNYDGAKITGELFDIELLFRNLYKGVGPETYTDKFMKKAIKLIKEIK